jgi:hypothetical protein
LASAATRLVPAEYTTIQNAIDAAVDGDVVIIEFATYTGDGNRDIDFMGQRRLSTVRERKPNNTARSISIPVKIATRLCPALQSKMVTTAAGAGYTASAAVQP